MAKSKHFAFISGLALALSLSLSTPALSQVGHTDTETLMNRLNQLDNQMQTLSRYIYQQNPEFAASLGNGQGSSQDNKAVVAAFEMRMSELEQQIRAFTGDIERLQFDVRQLTQKNMLLDSRLGALLQKQEEVKALPHAITEPQKQTVTTTASTAVATTSASTSTSTNTTVTAPQNVLTTGNATEAYDTAFSYVQEKDYEKAEKAFKQFIDTYGDNDLVHNARYWLGETYYVRGEFDKASVVFAEAFKESPKGAKAADNLLKLGMSLGSVSKITEACVTLTELKNRFPDAPASLLQRANQQLEKYSCDEQE